VKRFLKRNYVPDMELFSLRSPEVTLYFAARFAEKHLSHLVDQEQKNAKDRVANL